MFYAKCNKCKRVCIEVSKEDAAEEGYLEEAKQCMCGNSYNNFTKDFDIEKVPNGVTLGVILIKDE